MKIHLTDHAIEQFAARYPALVGGGDPALLLQELAETARHDGERLTDGARVWRNGDVSLAVKLEGAHATVVTVLPPSAALVHVQADPDAEIRAEEAARRAAMTEEEHLAHKRRIALRDADAILTGWLRGTGHCSKQSVFSAIAVFRRHGEPIPHVNHPRLTPFLQEKKP